MGAWVPVSGHDKHAERFTSLIGAEGLGGEGGKME